MSENIEELIEEILDQYPENNQSVFQYDALKDMLKLLVQQKPQYKSFKYLGIGKNGIVFKISEDIAIKIILIQNQQSVKFLEQIKQAYDFLNSYSPCDYILKVYQMDFLIKTFKNQQSKKCYVLVESEVCEGNLNKIILILMNTIYQKRELIKLLKPSKIVKIGTESVRNRKIINPSFRCSEFLSLKEYLSQ